MSRHPSSDPASTAPWRPITTADELLAAARHHGLEVTASAADLDQTGLDFLVVHARDADGVPWVLRTPRRAEVFAASRGEARALALVADRLPAQVPGWRVHAPDLIAYRRLPGTPAITVSPDGGPAWHLVDPAAPSPAFLDSLAAVLAALQAVPVADAMAAAIAVETVAEARAAHRQAMAASRSALEPSPALWARWQRWVDDDAMWPEPLALVHGDLHPGHLLLDDGVRVTGILDWSEAKLADPTVDLAMVHGCFGQGPLESVLERMAAAGAPVPPRAVERAVERWLAFPALAAVWAERTGHAGALDHARGLVAASAAG